MKKMPAELLLYIHAYNALNKLTPLSGDCGKLCGGRCCKGDSETGMLLFPYEELLLSETNYRILEREMQGRSVKMAVCTGRCDRRLRPLSCRIYPYAPFLRGGRVSVEPDPRAVPFCPLLLPEAQPYIQPEFLSAIRSEFTRMLQSSALTSFLSDYTAMLDEYKRFVL